MPHSHPGEQRAHHSQAGLAYLLAVPLSLSASAAPFPLLVFLHGAGESGTDPQELLAEGATGTPTSLAAARAEHVQGYVVASPQTDRGWGGPGVTQKLMKLIDELLSDPKLRLDPKRIVLAGVSMGGAGVWSVATAHPQRFAALVPVCGYGDPERIAAALGQSAAAAVWVWHGANDVVVSASASDEVVAALKAKGSAVRYERLAHAPAPVGWPSYDGHASWIPAFAAESPLWGWLEEQRAA